MPRDGAPTRARILDTAERLVLERGFAATSIDEVIAGSGSSKGAFFHHFPTKNNLARALLSRYAAADVDTLRSFMAAAEEEADDPAGQVIAFVRLFEEAGDAIVAEQPSCLYVSFVNERQLAQDGTAEMIVDAIVAWRTTLRDKLEAATARRPPRPAIDLDALADHVFVTFEGAFILARATSDGSHMRRQLRVLRTLLESLFDAVPAARPGGPRRAASTAGAARRSGAAT